MASSFYLYPPSFVFSLSLWDQKDTDVFHSAKTHDAYAAPWRLLICALPLGFAYAVHICCFCSFHASVSAALALPLRWPPSFGSVDPNGNSEVKKKCPMSSSKDGLTYVTKNAHLRIRTWNLWRLTPATNHPKTLCNAFFFHKPWFSQF